MTFWSVYRGVGAAGSISVRVTEWIPSAPTRKSPTTSLPSTKDTMTPPPSGRRDAERSRLPYLIGTPHDLASACSTRYRVARVSVRASPAIGRPLMCRPAASNNSTVAGVRVGDDRLVHVDGAECRYPVVHDSEKRTGVV